MLNTSRTIPINWSVEKINDITFFTNYFPNLEKQLFNAVLPVVLYFPRNNVINILNKERLMGKKTNSQLFVVCWVRCSVGRIYSSCTLLLAHEGSHVVQPEQTWDNSSGKTTNPLCIRKHTDAVLGVKLYLSVERYIYIYAQRYIYIYIIYMCTCAFSL